MKRIITTVIATLAVLVSPVFWDEAVDRAGHDYLTVSSALAAISFGTCATVVSDTNDTGNDGIELGLPTIVADELLLGVGGHSDAGDVLDDNPDQPTIQETGWALEAGAEQSNGTDVSVGVSYDIADSQTGTQTLFSQGDDDAGANYDDWTGQICPISGVDTATPFVGTCTSSGAQDSTTNDPAASPVAAVGDYVVVFLSTIVGTVTDITPSTGYTQYVEHVYANAPDLFIQYKEVTSAGADDPGTIGGLGTNTESISITCVLDEGATAPTASVALAQDSQTTTGITFDVTFDQNVDVHWAAYNKDESTNAPATCAAIDTATGALSNDNGSQTATASVEYSTGAVSVAAPLRVIDFYLCGDNVNGDTGVLSILDAARTTLTGYAVTTDTGADGLTAHPGGSPWLQRSVTGDPAAFTDLFNRADAAIGSDWTVVDGTSFDIVSNEATSTGTGENLAHVATATYTFATDHEAYIVFPDDATNAEIEATRPAVRVTASGDAYIMRMDQDTGSNTNLWYIDGAGAGAGTAIIGTCTDVTASAGDNVRLRIVGSTITGWHNGTSICSATDSTITTGYPGLGAFNSLGVWEEFSASDVPLSTTIINVSTDDLSLGDLVDMGSNYATDGPCPVTGVDYGTDEFMLDVDCGQPNATGIAVTFTADVKEDGTSLINPVFGTSAWGVEQQTDHSPNSCSGSPSCVSMDEDGLYTIDYTTVDVYSTWTAYFQKYGDGTGLFDAPLADAHTMSIFSDVPAFDEPSGEAFNNFPLIEDTAMTAQDFGNTCTHPNATAQVFGHPDSDTHPGTSFTTDGTGVLSGTPTTADTVGSIIKILCRDGADGTLYDFFQVLQFVVPVAGVTMGNYVGDIATREPLGEFETNLVTDQGWRLSGDGDSIDNVTYLGRCDRTQVQNYVISHSPASAASVTATQNIDVTVQDDGVCLLLERRGR